jgi:DHA2 family multidrug resistance protein
MRWLLLGVSLATGMEFYTFDSMNLVLADMTGTLGLSADEASWLLTVYSCSLFFGVPVSIWLAASVGYKRFLIATTILFAIASMGCAISPSVEILLAWRAIQGLAGAGLVVWWRGSVYLLVPKANRRKSMMRISTSLFLSSAAGLVASGYLTDRFDWRLIFVPNLLYAAGAVYLLLRYYPDVPPRVSARLTKTDWLGIALLAVALVSLQIVLNRGQIDDWFGSSFIRTLTLVGVGALALFLLLEFSPHYRMRLLDLGLMRNRHVMSSILIGVLAGMILSGSLFVLPEYLRNISARSYSATQTGQIVSVYALTAAASRPYMLPVIALIGQRKTIVLALMMLIASMLFFQHFLTTDTPTGYYVLPLMLYALCVSPLLPAIGSSTIAQISEDKLLDGLSLYMIARQFGASLGVAVLNILLAHRETWHSSNVFEHLRRNDAGTLASLAARSANAIARGHSSVDSRNLAMAQLVEAAKRQAETLTYADAFAFMAVLAVVALCLVPIIPPTPVIRK